jgi:hypothetical protein
MCISHSSNEARDSAVRCSGRRAAGRRLRTAGFWASRCAAHLGADDGLLGVGQATVIRGRPPVAVRSVGGTSAYRLRAGLGD